MYAYIRGSVEYLSEDSVILDNQGIGYRIFVPSSAKGALRIGDVCTLYTHFSVREDAMQLYGFLSKDDLEIFRMLLGVSGIGPKGALAVLSVMSADDIRFAVLSDDVTGISKAPGIGRKTAQKVILELKDKLDLREAFDAKIRNTEAAGEDVRTPENEALLALTSLGYSRAEALRAVKNASGKITANDAESLIRAALREMI